MSKVGRRFYQLDAFLFAVVTIIIMGLEFGNGGCIDTNEDKLSPEQLLGSNYRYVVYGEQDNQGIKMFDLKTLQYMQIIAPGKNERLAMSLPKPYPNKGSQIVFIENNIENEEKSRLVILNIKTGEKKTLLSPGINSQIYNFSISKNAEQIMFINQKDNSLYLWNATGNDLKKLKKHNKNFNEVYFSGGVFYLIDFEEMETHLYNTNGEFIRKYGKIILARSDQGNVRLIFDKKERIKFLEFSSSGRTKKVFGAYSVFMTEDGEFLVYDRFESKHKDSLIICETRTGKEITLDLQNHIGPIQGVALLRGN